MNHILDNPVWNALISGNKSLASGAENAKYFPEGVSCFAGLKQTDQDHLDLLYNDVPEHRSLILFSPGELPEPANWEVIYQMRLLQMVFDGENPGLDDSVEIRPLKEQHIEDMIALSQMTKPGPFFKRTIEFGNYFGIFEDDELISMAGQRLRADKYIEISNVCTHAAHQDKGYACKLMSHQINEITKNSCIPFLHVKAKDLQAFKLYRSLGFKLRKELFVSIIRKM